MSPSAHSSITGTTTRKPFAWTKDGDEILASIQCPKTKQTYLHATRTQNSLVLVTGDDPDLRDTATEGLVT